jgi:4-amino-4-deoxy-L-arabinose transferase-like glycosyltransferase
MGHFEAKKPLVWGMAAILLWLTATAMDRRTEIQVSTFGQRLHLEVSGATLSAPIAFDDLTSIEIRAMDSVDPPRGVELTIEDSRGEVMRRHLPPRFQFPAGNIVPVGDWELDELAGHGPVWRTEAVVEGPFTLSAFFRGRFHHDLEVVLHGKPDVSVAARRGLINNDAFIRTADGVTLASASIDPTPLADSGAIAASVLRAVAVACLLISVFTVIGSSGSSPAPAASRRLSMLPLAFALAVGAMGISIWMATSVLECLPHLPDSVTYLLQARWMLDGALWGTVSTPQDGLTVPYTYVVGDRWIGHYPAGWPFLLAIGLALGAPWLVAPVLGGIFVILLYLTGRELDRPATGLVAAVLGLLSPMVRIIFSCLLSHAAAATLILAGFWLFLISRRNEGWSPAAISGVCFGLAFGIRPLSAVAASVPVATVFGAAILTHHRDVSRTPAIGWFAGAICAALPTLAANLAITGNPFAFPYSLAGKSMYLASNLPFGIRNLDVLLYTAGNLLHGWGWPFFHGRFWVALAFAFGLVPFLLRRKTAADLLLALMIGSMAIAHLASRGHGLHGFGPRYLFEVFGPLLLLTARGFTELAHYGGQGVHSNRRSATAIATGLFVMLCGFAAVTLPQRLALYHGYNGIDESLALQISETGLERALILLPVEDWRGWAMASRMMEPAPDSDLLFLQSEPGDPIIAEITDGRPIYVWRAQHLTAIDEWSPTD